MINKRIVALMVAVLCSFLSFSCTISMAHDGPQTENPTEEYVIINDTPCYGQVGDTDPWKIIPGGTPAVIYTDQADSWVMIGVYPDATTGSRNSCWMQSEGLRLSRATPVAMLSATPIVVPPRYPVSFTPLRSEASRQLDVSVSNYDTDNPEVSGSLLESLTDTVLLLAVGCIGVYTFFYVLGRIVRHSVGKDDARYRKYNARKKARAKQV